MRCGTSNSIIATSPCGLLLLLIVSETTVGTRNYYPPAPCLTENYHPYPLRPRTLRVLQARQWNNPRGPARRFLSHLLTYPLTLASGLREAGLGHGQDTAPTASGEKKKGLSPCPDKSSNTSTSTSCRNDISSSSRGKDLAVVCLGARAESTMPPMFWRETLFALPCVSHLSLHLIGPELGLPPGVATVEGGDRSGGRRVTPSARHKAVITVGVRTAEIGWTRAVLGTAAGACVKGEEEPEAAISSVSGAEPGAEERAVTAAATATVTAEENVETVVDVAVDNAHAFVLFNPGLGHPHLRKGWAGALERLLATGKPIIVSCNSRKDLERDARVLREAGAAHCCPGREATAMKGEGSVLLKKNAFRSLMVTEDPLSAPGAEELVSCNWGILVVRGVQEDRTGSADSLLHSLQSPKK